MSTEITLADVCVTAFADLLAGDGEIMASPMATVPLVGARLARLTSNPDLVLTDGEARILAEVTPVGRVGALEGWMPFRRVFDVVASGRRHVIMGANQIDRHGNQNLSAFGPLQHPKRQMFGVRGAPGNTINHATSYWVGRHGTRVFCPQVDIISGIGTDRYRQDDPAFRFHDLRQVITDLGVFDFDGPGRTLRAVSLHPGVSASAVVESTGFEVAGLDDAGVTREPTAAELEIIRHLDPRGVASRELPRPEASR